MRRVIRLGLPLLVLGAVASVGAAMAATASRRAPGTVRLVASAKYGKVLVAANGRTLYRYTDDSKGVNRCTANATCAKYWPQLLVKGSAKPSAGSGVAKGLLGTIKAAHGSRQVTYAGFPLYFFAGDKKAGQVNGQGFEKEWYVVNAKGALVKHAMKAASASAPAASNSSSSSSSSSSEAWG